MDKGTSGSQKELEMWIILEKIYSILWVDKYTLKQDLDIIFSSYTDKRKCNIW